MALIKEKDVNYLQASECYEKVSNTPITLSHVLITPFFPTLKGLEARV